jgi:hypothetical protein
MKRFAIASLALLVWALAVTPPTAQEQYLQVEGWVQWISAQRLQLVLDSGLSISVDLTHVPQDQYEALAPGSRDRVLVVGVISPNNRRLIASSVTRVHGWSWGVQSPQSP